MGDAAFAETAAAMAAGLGPPGAPLRTLALVLAGRPDAALPAPAAGGAIANGHPAPGTRPAAGHPAHAAPADEPRSGGSGGALSLFGLGKPRAGSAGGGDAAGSDRAGQGLHAPPGAPEAPDAGAVLDGWRANLAILAANRSPGDEGVLARLGDALWHERGMVRLAACQHDLGGLPFLALALGGAGRRGAGARPATGNAVLACLPAVAGAGAAFVATGCPSSTSVVLRVGEALGPVEISEQLTVSAADLFARSLVLSVS